MRYLLHIRVPVIEAPASLPTPGSTPGPSAPLQRAQGFQHSSPSCLPVIRSGDLQHRLPITDVLSSSMFYRGDQLSDPFYHRLM